MKKNYFLLAALLTPCFVSAVVTLDIDQGGFTNGASSTNGMAFGILVDTSGNGFLPGSYNPFNITTNGQFLDVGGSQTDDWFVYDGTQGTGQTPPLTAAVFPKGDGTISNVPNIDYTNLAEDQEFAVMWFPASTASTVGDSYGLATDTGATKNMLIPADGALGTMPPSSVSTKNPGFTVAAVPEPAEWAAIFGVFALGLTWFRRRRS